MDESRDGLDSDRPARSVDREVPLPEPHGVGVDHLVGRAPERHDQRSHQMSPGRRTGPSAMVETAHAAVTLDGVVDAHFSGTER